MYEKLNKWRYIALLIVGSNQVNRIIKLDNYQWITVIYEYRGDAVVLIDIVLAIYAKRYSLRGSVGLG